MGTTNPHDAIHDTEKKAMVNKALGHYEIARKELGFDDTLDGFKKTIITLVIPLVLRHLEEKEVLEILADKITTHEAFSGLCQHDAT